jgi:hypothetical protein
MSLYDTLVSYVLSDKHVLCGQRLFTSLDSRGIIMPDNYQVSVLTPCQGSQVVAKEDDTMYSGTSGDFTFVNMSYNGSDWKLSIFDYRTGSGCFGASEYYQLTPDPDPTASQFGKADANGDPDPDLGLAAVSTL